MESPGQGEFAEVRHIDAALLRTSAGTYAHYQKCGEEIVETRLTLLPVTPFCRTFAA